MTAPASRPALLPRPLLFALYFLALAFILPSLLEFLIVSFPYRPGVSQWRFGAVGLLINTVLFPPIVGIAIGSLVSVQLGHRWAARIFSILALLMALVLALGEVSFLLDYLQLRSSVNPQALHTFDMTALKALLTGVIMIATSLSIGLGVWRAGGPLAEATPRAARRNTIVAAGAPNTVEAAQS